METPPGDLKGGYFLSLVNDTRALIRRPVEILQLLREGDKSVRGNFDFSNFRVDTRKKVKLDYEKFALQVHTHFLSRGMPTELKGWLRLLLEHSAEQEYLIVQSIALMEPMKAISHFLILYGKFSVLRKARPND